MIGSVLMKKMIENELSNLIISKAILIHKALGPGLLESVYESILMEELMLAGVEVRRQVALPVVWRNRKIEHGYRIDLLVENLIICEIKATELIHPVHTCQLLTYLRLSEKKLGRLINFHTPMLKEGIRRVVNGL